MLFVACCLSIGATVVADFKLNDAAEFKKIWKAAFDPFAHKDDVRSLVTHRSKLPIIQCSDIRYINLKCDMVCVCATAVRSLLVRFH